MKSTTRSPALRKSTRSRRGVLSLELILTLPILLIVLMGLFEFTVLFYSRSLVVEATRVGARKASLPGATAASVEEEIRNILSPRLQTGIQVGVDVGLHSGDVVVVSVQTPMTSASPDLLWPIGLSLNGRNLYSETRMIRE
ncbi:MAG: TadE family protein [Schlesneria sp.]|nr:TadE family protein [Schlesneria sp.]